MRSVSPPKFGSVGGPDRSSGVDVLIDFSAGKRSTLGGLAATRAAPLLLFEGRERAHAADACKKRLRGTAEDMIGRSLAVEEPESGTDSVRSTVTVE